MPAPANAAPVDPDLLLDDDDAPGTDAATQAELPPWRILIVDDDVDVHVVTKFALSNNNFRGRRLSFLHAYSAAEALSLLRQADDIALVLLDVIMETQDAGLKLVRQIRQDLHNDLVRIVLRTGQPGTGFEQNIIVDYDINDFWSKTDLTTRKLFTTVVASLRCYASLRAAAMRTQELQERLEEQGPLLATIDEHALMLSLDTHGFICEANPLLCRLTGLSIEQLRGRAVGSVMQGALGEADIAAIRDALDAGQHWQGVLRLPLQGDIVALQCTVRVFERPRRYIALATVID